MARVSTFNITYTSANTLFLEWTIIDHYHTIYYLQISIEQPYRISHKNIYANQTRGLISEKIDSLINDIIFV